MNEAPPAPRLPRRCGLAIATMALAASCSRDPIIEERAVTVYSPLACPVTESEAYSFVYAVGDFESAADRPAAAGVFLREHGRAMPELPADSRALIVDVSQGDDAWRGVRAIDESGPVDVLVWPGGRSCHLTRSVERRDGVSFGVFGRHFMVAGGRSLGGEQVPHTFVGDLSTGAITELAVGLSTRRANPSITEFRAPPTSTGPSGALVAGGHDPDSDVDGIPLRAIASAEVYAPNASADGDIGEFEKIRIDLSEPRAHHGAVVLATGETLLVGGRGDGGLLRTMEIVDPALGRARTAGVALLTVPRENPTVLRLASGEILVAGGLDANKNEVATLEWFSPDASRPTKRPVDLVTGSERAFIPLEAGGALAIVRPVTATPDFKTVWVISADGTLEPGEALDPTFIDAIRLFRGSDGAPALWTGRRWLRWSPWLARFDAMTSAPTAEQGGFPGPVLDSIASGDPGLALWLDADDTAMNVVGFRFATRTPFDAVPQSLLVNGVDRFAPDRIALRPDGSIRFDVATGLALGTGASAFLTDLTFADFDADLDVTSEAPLLVLRPDHGSELEVGGASCALTEGAQRSLHVTRRGQHVSVRVDGGIDRTCPTDLEAGVRVSLGLRGRPGAAVSSGRNLRLSRR